jgi:GNAT superfamily N-acetyltransferase
VGWSEQPCAGVLCTFETISKPDYRRHGIGTALVTSVLERAQKAGVVAVDLEVDTDHKQAISLYQRFGFRQLKRTRWVKEFAR